MSKQRREARAKPRPKAIRAIGDLRKALPIVKSSIEKA